MEKMRVALEFGRADVDCFLQEIDHDQYQEWRQFFAMEPHGWSALKIICERLTWAAFQSHCPKKLKEQLFELKLQGPSDPNIEKIRFEAYAIRSRLEEKLRRKQRRA